MRYDTQVQFFEELSASGYDTETGEKTESGLKEVKRFAHVYAWREDRKVELMGRMDTKVLTVHYPGSPIRAVKAVIDKGVHAGKYNVISRRSLRNKHSMTLEETKK